MTKLLTTEETKLIERLDVLCRKLEDEGRYVRSKTNRMTRDDLAAKPALANADLELFRDTIAARDVEILAVGTQ